MIIDTQNVADLSAATGQTLEEVLAGLGVELAALVGALGIDLGNLTQAAATELLNLARTLNVELGDLATSLGIDLGTLGNNDSFLNQLLREAIGGLPPEFRSQLQPLFDDIAAAEGPAALAVALGTFEAAIAALPLSIQSIFAPLFDNIDIDGTDLITGNVTLSDTNTILDAQTGLLTRIARALEGQGGEPDKEPAGGLTLKGDVDRLEDPLLDIADNTENLPNRLAAASAASLENALRDIFSDRDRLK